MPLSQVRPHLHSVEFLHVAPQSPSPHSRAVLLPQPEIDYAYTLSAGYMFPRRDGIVLGGTFQFDRWSLEPDTATTARILASHKTISAALRRA